MLIVGEPMSPSQELGDMAMVNPKLPPMKGKEAIFIAGEDVGEFRAIINWYIGATMSHWRVVQFNPRHGQPGDLKLARKIGLAPYVLLVAIRLAGQPARSSRAA